MPLAMFYTPDGDEVEIESAEVVDMTAGDDDDTTVIELEDGSEVTVSIRPIEAAAELGLNPLDFADAAGDDGIDDLADDDLDDPLD